MPNIDQFKLGKEPSAVSIRQYPELKGTKCWLWTGSTDVYGYGWLSVRCKKQKAHRYSFYLRYSHYPMPCGLHKCDVRLCINPEHIFEGTRQQNWKDRDAKGRGNQPKGSKHGNSVLTEEQVKLIKLSKKTVLELSKKYKVSRSSIYDILENRGWKHVH